MGHTGVKFIAYNPYFTRSFSVDIGSGLVNGVRIPASLHYLIVITMIAFYQKCYIFVYIQTAQNLNLKLTACTVCKYYV